MKKTSLSDLPRLVENYLRQECDLSDPMMLSLIKEVKNWVMHHKKELVLTPNVNDIPNGRNELLLMAKVMELEIDELVDFINDTINDLLS